MAKTKKNNLYIFNKSITNNSKLISLKNLTNTFGEIQYFPAASKEWKNSVYTFNTNSKINLNSDTRNINAILKSYFSSRFLPKFNYKKYKPRWVRRPSMNKIYISKAEIQHTNSKALLTIHTYNREKKALLWKIRKLKLSFLNKIEILAHKRKKYIGTKILKKVILNLLVKKLIILRKYKLRLNLNKSKFEEKFLYKLANIIDGGFFNKKIEFNIINLRTFILNSDIFTRILAHKLWKRKIRVLKMMKFILHQVILPDVNQIIEKSRVPKSVNLDLLGNQYENFSLSYALQNNNLNQFLKESYNNIILTNSLDKDFIKMYKIIFNSIKFKGMSGIRLNIKGRLTKRNRADRAFFKVKWKGGLRNIYSSYKGLSSVKYRGYINPNVEYSISTSKRRLGSFAVKGWLSGR
jgi:hypothetical protein